MIEVSKFSMTDYIKIKKQSIHPSQEEDKNI